MNVVATRIGGSAIGLVSAMSIGMFGIAGAWAAPITPGSVDPMAHIWDCFDAMMHDSAAHAQFCSPGQPGSNSTLATPMGGATGPACVTLSFNTYQPRFDSYELASLDDAISGHGADRYLDHTRLAGAICGGCGGASLTTPLFQTYETASLDESIAPAAAKLRAPTMLVGTCCDGSLDQPLFKNFDSASLETVPVPAVNWLAVPGSLKLTTSCR